MNKVTGQSKLRCRFFGMFPQVNVSLVIHSRVSPLVMARNMLVFHLDSRGLYNRSIAHLFLKSFTGTSAVVAALTMERSACSLEGSVFV